jgi:hypothetical protein
MRYNPGFRLLISTENSSVSMFTDITNMPFSVKMLSFSSFGKFLKIMTSITGFGNTVGLLFDSVDSTSDKNSCEKAIRLTDAILIV